MAQRPPIVPPPSDQRASATLPNPSRRQRASRRSHPPMTMMSAATSEDDRLRAEWRTDVTRELERSAQAHQQTAVILERLSNRLDEHDRRIAALEQAPGQQAQQQQTRAGLNLQAVYVGVAICALVVAILSPHLSLALH